MKIEITPQLSSEQAAAITELEKLSFREDTLENHAFLSAEINFDASFPCFYLGYEGEALVAFLTTFVPTSLEAEILAVTHPDHRRKGCFKALLEAAKVGLSEKGIKKMLFAVEPKSTTAVPMLKSYGNLPLEHSEYTMSCSHLMDDDGRGCLTFERATAENRVIFTAITMESFPDIEPNSSFIRSVLTSGNRACYIAYNGDVPVGVFYLNFANGMDKSARYGSNVVYLYGVAVAKCYRGQGFGKQIVRQALKEGIGRAENMVLDVDSDNPAAFSMYKKCGFVVDFQVDYYRYLFE